MATRRTPVQANDGQPSGSNGVGVVGALSPAEESAFLLVRDGAQRAALEIGQPPEALFALLGQAFRVRASHISPSDVVKGTGSPRHHTATGYTPPPDFDIIVESLHAPVVQNLQLIDDLIGRLDALKTTIRENCPIEASSTEVRKNWAEFLDRVRVNDESIYVTQHGKRVAALVPAYIAESYAADQAWFNTPEWQAKEAEADADIAAGRLSHFESDEDFEAALDAEGE